MRAWDKTPGILTAKFPGTCKVCWSTFPAGTAIVWAKGAGSRHLDAAACALAKATKIEASKVTPVVPLPMKAVVDFLGVAKAHGLKYPSVRFLAPGGGELRLSVAGPKSKAPGSIQVKIDDVWIGRVEPDGRIVGRVLAARTDVQTTLETITADPATAAAAYGALRGACSFCAKSLTDEGSVEVGYGPVCARHYSLPWSRKGVKVLELAVAS